MCISIAECVVLLCSHVHNLETASKGEKAQHSLSHKNWTSLQIPNLLIRIILLRMGSRPKRKKKLGLRFAVDEL